MTLRTLNNGNYGRLLIMDNAGLVYIINRYITGFRVFGPQVPASLRSFFGSFLPSKEAPTEAEVQSSMALLTVAAFRVARSPQKP